MKEGNVVTFRYQKSGKSWFYCEKLTRIDGDKVYYTPQERSTSGSDARLKITIHATLSRTKAELEKYDTKQGDEQKRSSGSNSLFRLQPIYSDSWK